MKYAHVVDGGIRASYQSIPVSFNQVDNFQSLTDQERALHGFLRVLDVTPVYDQQAFRLKAKSQPALAVYSDRVELIREVEAIPQAEIAQKQLHELISSDNLAIELRTMLSTATPQQIKNYIDNNVTDLPSARQMLKRIVILLAILCR